MGLEETVVGVIGVVFDGGHVAFGTGRLACLLKGWWWWIKS